MGADTGTGSGEPARRRGDKAPTLQGQLLRSHLRIGGLSGLILVLAAVAVQAVQQPIRETERRHVPMAQAAMTIQVGLHRASAALNGWVALKDTKFRDVRERAWADEIRPALATLKTLEETADDAAPAAVPIASLELDLDRLASLQEWIVDVATKPGNEPARMVLIQELLPLSGEMERSLRAALAATEGRGGPAYVRAELNELRLALAKSDGALGRFVVEGLALDEADYSDQRAQSLDLLRGIRGRTSRGATTLTAALDELAAQLETYHMLAESIVASRKSARSNVAWNTIEVRLKPLEDEIAAKLEAIARRQVSMVTVFVGRISRWISTFNVGSLLMLILVTALAAYLSVIGARRLATPIRNVSRAVERLAGGHFRESLNEEGVQEVRQLIASFKRMQRAIEVSHDNLRRIALHDELTGLPNRKAFNDRLARLEHRAGQANGIIGMLIVDLDYFKEVNDALGHDAGDALLKVFAERLQSCIRESDLAARLGGDEFAIILTDLAERSGVESAIDRIRRTTAKEVRLGNKVVTPSCTIGAAVAEARGFDGETVLKHADLALYSAKRQQRGTHCFYQDTMKAEITSAVIIPAAV
ncbi:MAG: sensor domain-containing diguanylate cyclase [Pseudomonadota bacterium]